MLGSGIVDLPSVRTSAFCQAPRQESAQSTRQETGVPENNQATGSPSPNLGVSRRIYPTIGQIVSIDNSFSSMLAEDAQIEVIASGLTWCEGPVWVDRTATSPGYLLFSDIPRNSIFRWTETGGVEMYLHPSGYTGRAFYGLEPGSNGLAIDFDGSLLACEHGDRRISSMATDGGKKTLVDSFEGKRLNSPNDLILHRSGDIFFTDPPYGLPNRENDSRREQLHFGVYRLDRKTNSVALLTSELERPNGIAFSPDQTTLYVAQSDPKRAIIMRFPVNPDLTLGVGSVFFDATAQVGKLPGLPDGMCVDRQGNLWATGPGGVWVLSPTGKLLGRLDTGEKTSNCTIGDDGKYLFITADSLLCRVRLRTP